jgi:hypothetical protein
MEKGRKPALGFLRAWGCLAKVNVPACKKRKLGPNSGGAKARLGWARARAPLLATVNAEHMTS